MTNKFEELRNFVAEMERDFERFYDEGDRVAGTRVREGMQKLKQISPGIRIERISLSPDVQVKQISLDPDVRVRVERISPDVREEVEGVSVEGEEALEAEVDQLLRETLDVVRACRTQIRHTGDVLERVHHRANEISTAYRQDW